MKHAGWLRIVLSVLCVLLAALLIAAVTGVYLDGAAAHAADPLSPVFTRETLKERFRPLAPLFCAVAVLTAAGLILRVKEENGAAQKGDGRTDNRAPDAKTVRAARTALLILAAVLIAAGIWNGSAGDVFQKAVRICTECIGLG